ncbi:nucleolar protein 10-like [Trifolium pratense]|uniref:Nucleolar protein 10-like n=1 Tax=Trifolium pratense TaxID=57577 RepID=A0A2K3NHZ9_TRIPR|nr:nucleolar protein 10-like [Trifolium pratense]
MATRDGGIKSTSINGVKVYTIASQQPSVASWLPTKKQQSHRSIKSYTQNVQLIEDLRFTTATTKIKATPDGEYIIASAYDIFHELFSAYFYKLRKIAYENSL